eukprot:scaffold1178_cov252-Pinguiococcus_pyrenoidosus.AAC.43
MYACHKFCVVGTAMQCARSELDGAEELWEILCSRRLRAATFTFTLGFCLLNVLEPLVLTWMADEVGVLAL